MPGGSDTPGRLTLEERVAKAHPQGFPKLLCRIAANYARRFGARADAILVIPAQTDDHS